MRELKFRVWDKRTNCFLPDYCRFGLSTSSKGFLDLNELFEENYILNQFTGLTDKNKKEIYEGDIVKWIIKPLNLRYEEEWEEWEKQGSIMENYIQKVEYLGAYIKPFIESPFVPYSSKTCEIIGNIHENPELINNI